MNATAAVVWEACGEGASQGEIVGVLCERFSVEDGKAREDVDQILQQFVEVQLFQ